MFATPARVETTTRRLRPQKAAQTANIVVARRPIHVLTGRTTTPDALALILHRLAPHLALLPALRRALPVLARILQVLPAPLPRLAHLTLVLALLHQDHAVTELK